MKVSIIVPVYNMEKLIGRCLDSLINQTYSDIEVIVIDDGSSDDSGRIANNFATRDDRIVVAHHSTNEGIANAFVTGLNNVSGDFVLFVDSDNYISNKMVEVLMERLMKYDADVVQCGALCYTDEKFIPKEETNISNFEIILTGVEIRRNFIDEKHITNNLSAKLFKRCLFESINIPRERQIVDVIILPQIINKCNKYICIHDNLYYAYQPFDSVSRSSITVRRIDDLLYGNDFYESFITENWTELISYIPYRKIITSLWAYDKILFSNDIDEKDYYLELFYKIICRVYKEAKKTIYYEKCPFKLKMKLYILVRSKGLYKHLVG